MLRLQEYKRNSALLADGKRTNRHFTLSDECDPPERWNGPANQKSVEPTSLTCQETRWKCPTTKNNREFDGNLFVSRARNKPSDGVEQPRPATGATQLGQRDRQPAR